MDRIGIRTRPSVSGYTYLDEFDMYVSNTRQTQSRVAPRRTGSILVQVEAVQVGWPLHGDNPMCQ